MKKYIFRVCMTTLMAGSFISCSDDDDNSSVNNNNGNINTIVNTANSGTWRITSFVDSGNDETNHFQDYNFTFGNNNVLTAVKTNTYTGTWSVTNSDNSNDDSPDDNDIDFNIVFNASAPADFIDLNDDWDVNQVTANKISLIDVSGGNGGTDILIFEKNN